MLSDKGAKVYFKIKFNSNILRNSEVGIFSFSAFPVSEKICLERSFVQTMFPDKPVTENPVTEYDRKTLQADFYKNNLDRTVRTSESSHTKTKFR